jgi:hypothetical protein
MQTTQERDLKLLKLDYLRKKYLYKMAKIDREISELLQQCESPSICTTTPIHKTPIFPYKYTRQTTFQPPELHLSDLEEYKEPESESDSQSPLTLPESNMFNIVFNNDNEDEEVGYFNDYYENVNANYIDYDEGRMDVAELEAVAEQEPLYHNRYVYQPGMKAEYEEDEDL